MYLLVVLLLPRIKLINLYTLQIFKENRFRKTHTIKNENKLQFNMVSILGRNL